MTLLPQSVDYTDRDFDSIRLRLQNLARSVYPDWTDYNIANFGNIMMEMFAHVGDVLTFYQDNQALQSRILKATQRKVILGLVKLINYDVSGASAATADETFTLAASPAADVRFPAGTIVKSSSVTEPVEFQLLTEVVIAKDADPPAATGSVENSKSRSEAFASNGLANQEIPLGFTPYLDDSAEISAANGAYTEVGNFLDSTSIDRHFTVTVDQNDKATVRFGNGINGVIPSGTITVAYKTGGGSSGKVNAGALSVIDGAFTDDDGNPVTVTVTNADAASGGDDRQTIEQIKALAPPSARTTDRTVTREDFEINALKVPGVARVLMLTSNEDATIGENQGILFVIPSGGGLPSTALKALVTTQVTVTFPPTLTFQVSVQDPDYLTVNVDATVHLAQGANPTTVGNAVRAALAAFFAVSLDDDTANPDVDFGFNQKDVDGDPAGEIVWSDVFNAVRDTDGVRKIGDQDDDFLLNGDSNDVPILVRQFPVLGTVVVRNGDTGALL